jgi:hypothetical protein
MGIMTPFFFLLHFFEMFTRIDPLEERVGLDYSHHKGGAYDYTGPLKADIEMLNRKLHPNEHDNTTGLVTAKIYDDDDDPQIPIH